VRKAFGGVLLIVLLGFAIDGQAQTLDFDFTIVGDQSHPGTVTGEIFGLTDNTTFDFPTEIEITSTPASWHIPPDFVVPYNKDVNGYFSVENGAITGELVADVFPVQDANGAVGTLLFNTGGLNAFEYPPQNGGQVSNIDGGTTFTLVKPVPLPGTWAMLLSALGMLGCLLRRNNDDQVQLAI
jgi:hypothetical protein